MNFLGVLLTKTFIAMRNYEGRIMKYCDQLEQLITTKKGQPVNVYDFFSFYTSDVMGDLAFGKPFNNILVGKMHPSVQGVRDFMGVFGTLSPIPWFIRLGSGLLMRLNGWKSFIEFTKQRMSERIMVRGKFIAREDRALTFESNS